MAPPLLLLLALLALTAGTLGAGTQGVQVPPNVTGFLGESVNLSCHLPPPSDDSIRLSQITWMKQGTEESLATWHPIRGVWYQDPERMNFVAAGQSKDLLDASLTLSALHIDDEARYTCHYATYPTGSSSGTTRLRVLARPQSRAMALKAQPASGPVLVARCESTGGHPPPQLSWSPSLNGTINTTQVTGPLPGTVSTLSLFFVLPSSQADGQTVTCIVEHETLAEPLRLPVNLTVLYPPEVSISGYDHNWYRGLQDVTLSCDIQSNPEPTKVNWTTISGTLPLSAQVQGTQLHIPTVDEAINTTFICSATNTLGTGQGEVSIILRETPSALTSWKFIFLAVMVVGMVLILIVVSRVLWRK
ncbi:poliovirus receptor homolog, partial [Thomomys bottae]